MKINKALAIVISLSVVLISSAVGLSTFRDNDNEKFFKELTVIYQQYDNNINRDEIEKNEFAINRLIVSNYDGRSYGEIDRAYDKENSFAVLQFDSPKSTENAYNQMQADGYIVDADGFASVDSYEAGELHPIGSQTVGTKQFIQSYGMARDDVLVAVIDTGVMLDHPDLQDRFYNSGYDFTSDACDNAYYDTGFETESYLHSTFISGIIANNTMDNVKIVPYKIVPFGASEGEVSAILAAINHAVDLGVDVINISVSSYSSRNVYESVINNAVNNGVCVCASAGNRGSKIEGYPAIFSQTITVGALNKSCTAVASYSSYGPQLDFTAPGSRIYSTIPTENGAAGYGEYSGTSFSSPYIASACANIKTMNSEFSKQEVYDILCDFSVDFGEEGRDDYYGNGVPNLSNMIYTDNSSYSLKLPQGELNVFGAKDYTLETQPWRLFANRIEKVTVDDCVNEIGNYCFYGMERADFSLPNINCVGSYAFYGCKKLPDFLFTCDVERIGNSAFGNISESFSIYGYRNTPAESYSLKENINFVSIGCNHNYKIEIIDPEGENEGYTIYTCLVCGDEYIGEYIEPVVVDFGKCGENVSYSLYNTGRLILSGSGEMYSYIDEKSPFEHIKGQIRNVYITEEVSSISPFAFACCSFIESFNSKNDLVKIINGSVYSGDEKALLYAFGEYEMPSSVESINAGAFINSNVSLNDNFVVENDLVYNKNGELVMALPSYSEEVLTVENDIKINDYAFILTEYPNVLRSYSNSLLLGDYSVGYSYDGELVKNNFSFYGYDNTTAYKYALDNGFKANPLNAGECGDNLSWRFNMDTAELCISGTGDMYSYKNTTIPWSDYMNDITSIVIGDEVGSLSVYSFFSANNVKSITVPLSLSVVESQTVWYGCQNVEEVILTGGTGVMPNYGSALRSRLYTYSPWYPSRDNLKSISISKDVKQIGKYAFRECKALKTLTLNDCDMILDGAFYDASNLENITILSKSTLIADNAFDKTAESFTVSAYSDSTVKDFALQNGIAFESIGCEHSRGFSLIGERASCCYDSQVEYRCCDCDYLSYSEFITAQGNGHFVKAIVTTLKGEYISNADVYIDGVLSAKTNNYGRFVAEEIKCEETHFVEIIKDGLCVASGYVETNSSNRSGELSVRFGDYVKDNVVNAKDYAYALKNNFEDKLILDYGKFDKANTVDISRAYSVQYAPDILNVYNEQSPDVEYRRSFYAETNFNRDYRVTQCGFIYGKDMEDDFIVLENVGKYNSNGYQLKISSVTEMYNPTFRMDYGSSSKTGKVSARFFIKYTNGVKDYLVYSDVTSYIYE